MVFGEQDDKADIVWPRTNRGRAALAVAFFVGALLFIDVSRPVLGYLEYLPVYRAERQYERLDLHAPTPGAEDPQS